MYHANAKHSGSFALALTLMLVAISLVRASEFGQLLRAKEASLVLRTRSRSSVCFASELFSRHQRTDWATHKMMANNKQVFFSSYTSGDDGVITESTNDTSSPSISSLMKSAQRVRNNLYGNDSPSLPSFLNDPSKKQLCYPSSTYSIMIIDDESASFAGTENRKKTNVVQRGYCNWLLPNKIMIGSYPGMTPEINGPTRQESRNHIQNMVQKANITLFCSLQSEVPCQMDDVAWQKKKKKKDATQFKLVSSGESEVHDDGDDYDDDVMYLEPDYLTKEFPQAFTRYGPLAQSFASEASFQQLKFLHSPIEDLCVPTCNTKLFILLSNLLQHLQVDEDSSSSSSSSSSCNTQKDHGRTIYLHCWGGRGRAGLVGACLASLLFPELSAESILNWIQCGYDTRLGAEWMAEELTRSPQTAEQRLFVKEFVALVHAEKESGEERK